MSLLLGRDDVELTPPGQLDEHGWRKPGVEPLWSGTGNLQLQPGISDPRMGDGGGRGPFGPARDNYGQLYLPADAPVIEGMTARVRERTYVLSQTRFVRDPTGTALDCWAATVNSYDSWPADSAVSR